MMTPENFVYWLQGFLEVGNPVTINKEQLRIIRDHLSLVFKKETPDRNQYTINDLDKMTEEKFVPFERSPAYGNPIVFEALGPLEKSKTTEFIPYVTSEDKYGSFTLSNDVLPDLSHLLQYDDVPISC